MWRRLNNLGILKGVSDEPWRHLLTQPQLCNSMLIIPHKANIYVAHQLLEFEIFPFPRRIINNAADGINKLISIFAMHLNQQALLLCELRSWKKIVNYVYCNFIITPSPSVRRDVSIFSCGKAKETTANFVKKDTSPEITSKVCVFSISWYFRCVSGKLRRRENPSQLRLPPPSENRRFEGCPRHFLWPHRPRGRANSARP